MIRTACLSIALLALTSCSSTLRHHSLRTELEDRTLMPAQDSLSAMANAEPTLTTPFRLGIAPPWVAIDPRNARYSEPGFGAWTTAERTRLNYWAEQAIEDGFIESAGFIPSLLLDATLPPLEAARLAGEVQHVDAVLVVQRATDFSSWIDEWGVLYFTLVGMVVVPATHVEAMTVADAFVIEVAGDGYIHAAVQGDAHAEDRTTAAREDHVLQKQVERSRARALDKVCEELRLAAEED